MKKETLPRIYSIMQELNRRLCQKLFDAFPGQWDRIGHMAIEFRNARPQPDFEQYEFVHKVDEVGRQEPHGTAGRGPYPKGEIARQQKVADDADAEGAKIGKGRPEVVETPHQHDVNGVIDRRGDASHHGEAHERTLIEPPEHHRYPTHRIRGIRGWSKTDSRGLSATPAAG